MHCDIYKFPKHDEMYVYIARPNYPNDTEELTDWLGVLPKELRASLGEGKFILHLDLDETPKLARVDKAEVLAKLESQGYYVQAPPQDILLRQAQNRVKDSQDKRYD
ncbi:MAG: YcgL domain-containing protein [Psychrobacter sp.]|nr:YcgL domain-containing protein [Psychrobacter sp.]